MNPQEIFDSGKLQGRTVDVIRKQQKALGSIVQTILPAKDVLSLDDVVKRFTTAFKQICELKEELQNLWKCGSRNTERVNQSTLWCWDCCKYFNADYNRALNIGLPFLAKAAGRGATVELAQTEDEQAREIVACKLGSPHPSG
jgi:hypothetical protein